MKHKILERYRQLPNWLKNRYFISVFCFLIWIFFFDKNSIITQIDQSKQIHNIEQDKKYYKKEIKQDKEIINIIAQDSLTPQLEKYLREKLLLSKDNEEIFIIE